MTDFTASRVAMVDCQIRPSDVTKFPILEAMLEVPREAFVPQDKRTIAYMGDHVDLGGERVVLDPRVLAKMLDAADIQPHELVLDLGAGLGYGAAIISRLADFVVALEEDLELAQEAQANLSAQSIDNGVVVEGSLCDGAAKHGPYDVMIIEGAVEEIPVCLLDQVKDGGRICAVFMEGALGQCRLGTRVAGKISWQVAFDATAPVLPGFTRAAAFTL